MAERIQLSRKKGWRMPENTVNVARPGKWGNPYVVGAPDPFWPGFMSQARVVELYRLGIEHGYLTVPHTRLTPEERGDRMHSYGAHAIKDVVHQLRGKNLACWCKPGDPCHADVLLEQANG